MSYHEQLQQMTDEVRRSERVDVMEADPGSARADLPDVATVFEWIAREGVVLDPRLQRCFAPISDFTLHWKLKGRAPNDGGEFTLYNLYDVIAAPAPRLWGKATPADERAFLEQLRPFDDQRHAGEGKFAAIRVEPKEPLPTVWFYQLNAPALQLDVDYCGYLDALLVTKGWYGWQYLFAEVDLGSRDLAFYKTQLATMLDTFPSLFPKHDYEPLRRRLAERTSGQRGAR